MTDLIERIERAGRGVDPAWGGADVERTVQGVRRKQRRRRVRRVLQAAALAGTAGVTLFLFWPVTPPAAPLAAGVVRLRDGSLATPLEPGTEMTAARDGDDAAVLELRRGRSRFEVAPQQGRTFQVHAGEVTVTVIGTVFTVERIADRIGVAVERGSVRVAWGTGERRLAAGESGWFPPLVAAHAAPAAAPAASAAAPAVAPLRAVRPPPPRSAAELLEAADEARRAHRLTEADALLDLVARQHPRDPRAPLAAFTRGRLLLADLHRPADAAAAFAWARALDPRGPLAEDALAREVEAWAKVPDAGRARARAEEYRRLFPAGRRLEDVRAASGGE